MDNKITTFTNDKGEIEYDFVGLDNWDDFDRILQYLIEQEEVIVVDILDGIFFRICHLKKNETEFKLIFHEDVGNYFVSLKQDTENNEKLYEMAQKIIVVARQ